MDENHLMDQVPIRPLDQKCRIFLVRNGEPCDRLMPAWVHKAFHEVDKYNLLDLNQPYSVVNRTASSSSKTSAEQAADLFKNDTPLTQIGRMCSKKIGAALNQRNVRFHTVFCSPAIRCVETANAIILETSKKESVRFIVEPGLVDPLMFYEKERNGLPAFLDTTSLRANGFDVDIKYSPIYHHSQLQNLKESAIQYHDRIATVVQNITTQALNKSDGNVLVVTHAPTVDLIARKLLGRKDLPKTKYDFYRMGLFYPFCSVMALENVEFDESKGTNKWVLKRQLIPPMTLGHVNTNPHMPSL